MRGRKSSRRAIRVAMSAHCALAWLGEAFERRSGVTPIAQLMRRQSIDPVESIASWPVGFKIQAMRRAFPAISAPSDTMTH